MKKLILLPLGMLILSSCTQMERFSTDKKLMDYNGDNAARVRITTNLKDVFAVPNHNCINLEKTVSANDQYARAPEKNKINSKETLKNQSLIPNEDLTKSLGMPKPKIDRHDFFDTTDSYSSREYRVEAGKPITFFIKRKIDKGLPLLFTTGIDMYSYGLSFIPEKDRDYQVTFTVKRSPDKLRPISRYTYKGGLSDITLGKDNPTLKLQKAEECRNN